MATVHVDMDLCIHSGMCTSLASETFTMDEDARLVVIQTVVDGEAEVRRLRDAVACCPVEAISMIDE